MELTSKSATNISSLYNLYNNYDDLVYGEKTFQGNMLPDYLLRLLYNDDSPEEIAVAVARMRMFNKFLLYFLPIMICVSFLGNLLVILAVLHKKKGYTSTEVYILSLAVGDLLVNCANTLNEYLVAFGFVERTYSTLDCKLRRILPIASHYISVWQLVIISTERAISVLIPHRVRYICSVGTARTTVITVWSVSLLIGIFINVITYPLNYNKSILACRIHSEMVAAFNIFFKIHNAILFFIPYTWIFCCTIAITITLAKNKMKSSNKRVSNSVTFTLMGLNIIFLLTQAPHHIFSIMDYTGFFDDYWSIVETIDMALVRSVTTFLTDANSAVNVFVYFLSGTRFRNDVKRLFKSWKMSPHRSVTDTTHTGSQRF